MLNQEKVFFILFLLLGSSTAFSQISITASKNYNDALDWNLFFYDHFQFDGNKNKMFQYSYELGIGYLLRMKRKRIDLHPTVSYSYGKKETYRYPFSEEGGVIRGFNASFNLKQININVPIKFYPLDFNAPNKVNVMTKENKVLKGGFFFNELHYI